MKHHLNHLLVIVIAIAILTLPAFASSAQKRPAQTADIHSLKDVSDPQISPDATRIVCVVSETSADRARTTSHIWMIPLSGGEAKRLTSDEASESNPRWSPDSKMIAFYSTRGGKLGLWVINVDGTAAGAMRQVARIERTNFHLKGAGESFAWSPDSKMIAFLTSPESVPDATLVVAPNAAMGGIPEILRRPLTRAEIDRLPPATRDMILRAQGASSDSTTSKTEGAPAAAPDDPRVITRLQYKSRTSFSDSLQSHIYLADLTTNRIRQLTATRYYEHSLNFSPKGDEVLFVSNREPDPDKVNNTDIFAANIRTGAVRQLTSTKGCEWMPVFSPDGSQIAYLATTRPVTTIDSVAEDTQVFTIPAAGGEPRAVSRPLDRRAFSVKWDSDGRSLLFTAGDRGRTLIYRATADGKIAPLFERRAQVGAFSLARDARVAFTMSAPDEPTEIYLASSSNASGSAGASGQLQRVSSFNRAAVAPLALSEPEQFTFTNEGFEIEGWLYRPAGSFDPARKYPLILSIHGGPHGMYGYSFNMTAQILAARGYAVLLINPRGSSGYGQKFSDGCVNDWGGGDYRDLMKGVDAALARFPFLDAARMGVMGGSYGGYMTNWVVTQTDRFKAGVAMASLSNLISFYSTSLYQDLIHAEFNGYPWDNFEKLWERSPLAHIKKAKTPLLLIHGEQDNDVHITQAEEMYTALKMRGIETVMVRYPREGHGLREPRHREDQLTRTLAWFDRHLR